MSGHITTLTPRRRRFTWSCSLAPAAFLVVFITMAVHIRLGIGYWPDPSLNNQSLNSFPGLLLRIHNWGFMAAILFGFFVAPIHLVVTLIHYRELGFRLRGIAAHAVAYLLSTVVFFLVIVHAPAWFVTWFTD